MGQWSELSAKEKAQIIKFAIKNGVSDINSIRDTYNVYAKDSLANVDYNMAAAKASGFGSNGNGHYPDTFKKPNHPTFSDESIYHSEVTPGGRWRGNTYEPSDFVLNQQGGWNRFLRGFYNQEQGTNAVPVFNGGVMLPEVTITPQYKEGGKIHIKPSKRGTFTAAATKHGKSVQEFARQVLANPENYSPAMRRKANFARNSAKWHKHDGDSDTQYLNTEVYEPWFPDRHKEEYGFNIGQWLGPMHVREMQLGNARNHSEASSYLVDSNKEFINDYISRLSAAHPELSSTALSDIEASLSPESIFFVPEGAFAKSNSAGETVARREDNKIVPEIRLRDNIGYYDTPNKSRDLSNIFRHELSHFLRKYQGNYADSVFNQDERGILNSAYFAVPSTLERAAENARLRSIISQNHNNVWGKELDDVIDNLSYEDLLSYISNMEGYMKGSESLYTAPDKKVVADLQSRIAEKDKERDAILNAVIYPKYLMPYEDGVYVKDNIINKYKTKEGEDASGVRDAMLKEWDENKDLKRIDSERKNLEKELKKTLMIPNKERLDAVKRALKQVAQNNSGFQKSDNTYLAALGGNLSRNAAHWGAEGLRLDDEYNTNQYNQQLDRFIGLGFKGQQASDLAAYEAGKNLQYDAGQLPFEVVATPAKKHVIFDNGIKNVHYAPHNAPVQESAESKIAAGAIGIPLATIGTGVLGSYVGGSGAGNALMETVNFLKNPVGRAMMKKAAVDMGLSILGGEAANALSKIFTQNTIGQNFANATNSVPYIQNIPYNVREIMGDFLNPGYFISGPLGRFSNTASTKLANFDIQNITNNVASTFKNSKFYPKLKRAYDRSYFGVRQRLNKGYKEYYNKNLEWRNNYDNITLATDDFIKQNTFNIRPASAGVGRLELKFRNPITGEVINEFVPVFEPKASLDLKPIISHKTEYPASNYLTTFITTHGEPLRGRNVNSSISAEIRKYTGQLEDIIGEDGVIVGSTSLYKDNVIAGIPGDVEFITTKNRLQSLKNKLGARKVKDLVGVPGENITSRNLIGASGDIEVIEQTPLGNAKGQTALEFYRIIDPEGYQKILETSAKKGKDVYELPLPISAEDLLKQIQADKSLVTKKTILDFLGSSKPKHASRAKTFITSGDTQTVTSSLQEMRRSLFGKQAKSVQELYPNIRFDDVEANKEFLDYVGMPESYATDPEIIKNIVDYFDLSESVTRSSVKEALKVNQATASAAGGGGNYLRASSVGGGRMFGDYTIVMGNTITTNNSLVHTPIDLVTAYKNSSEMFKPLEADVADILEKLTGKRFKNLHDISLYTSETKNKAGFRSLNQQFSDIADILGIRGMRTEGYDHAYFGNLSLREDMPQNVVYSKHKSSPLEVGGWKQKEAVEETSQYYDDIFGYDKDKNIHGWKTYDFNVYIPDKYKTNGVFDNEKFQKAIDKLKEETDILIKKADKNRVEMDRLRERNMLLDTLKDKKENAITLLSKVLISLEAAVGTGAILYGFSDDIKDGFMTLGETVKGNIKRETPPRPWQNASETTDKSGTKQHEYSTGGPLYPFSFQKNPYLKVPVVRYGEGGKKSTPSKAQIVRSAWENENPFNIGLLKNGMYEQYDDPNGEGRDAGPGLLVGATIPNKKLYTRQELDDAAYAFGMEGLASIGKAYNEKYGTEKFPTPFDTVSVAPKLLLLDTRYQNGRLPIANWPSLYQSVADGNWAEALKNSRSTYIKDGVKHYDNDRVRRRSESIFPGMFDVTFTPDSKEFPKVTSRKKSKK